MVGMTHRGGLQPQSTYNLMCTFMTWRAAHPMLGLTEAWADFQRKILADAKDLFHHLGAYQATDGHSMACNMMTWQVQRRLN